MLRLLLVTYVLGGLTFIPLVCALSLYLLWRYSPELNTARQLPLVQEKTAEEQHDTKTLKAGWITIRRTYEALPEASSVVNRYKAFMDNRSGDPRRMRQKDTFYAVLKQTATSNVLFLYDSDQQSTPAAPVDCWAAIDVTLHDCISYPSEGCIDGELWMKRTALVLRPKTSDSASVDASKDLSALEGTTDSLEPGRPLR